VHPAAPAALDRWTPPCKPGSSPGHRQRSGAALHERFARSYEKGSLITPGQSARSLMHHLATDATGETWNVNTSRPEE
jgi:hypothetical protein